MGWEHLFNLLIGAFEIYPALVDPLVESSVEVRPVHVDLCSVLVHFNDSHLPTIFVNAWLVAASSNRRNHTSSLLRALPTEIKVESGTPQSKSGTSASFSISGLFGSCSHLLCPTQCDFWRCAKERSHPTGKPHQHPRDHTGLQGKFDQAPG